MHARLQHVINLLAPRGAWAAGVRKYAVYELNWFSSKVREQQPWSSGMMLACHAGDPGSIPGGCSFAYVLARKAKLDLFITCFH